MVSNPILILYVSFSITKKQQTTQLNNKPTKPLKMNIITCKCGTQYISKYCPNPLCSSSYNHIYSVLPNSNQQQNITIPPAGFHQTKLTQCIPINTTHTGLPSRPQRSGCVGCGRNVSKNNVRYCVCRYCCCCHDGYVCPDKQHWWQKSNPNGNNHPRQLFSNLIDNPQDSKPCNH